MQYQKGDWVMNPKKEEWGRGYVIEVDNDKVTAQFQNLEKDRTALSLEYVTPALLKPNDETAREWLRERSEMNEARKQNKSRKHMKFPWPTTRAPIGKYGLGDVFHYKRGLLSYVGYSVGRSGEQEDIRYEILDWVFHNTLPRVKSEQYMSDWGEPETPARLRKMAECLASFARNHKRNAEKNEVDYETAIREWELDLKYLYDKYYVGRFRFSWPSANERKRASVTPLIVT